MSESKSDSIPLALIVMVVLSLASVLVLFYYIGPKPIPVADLIDVKIQVVGLDGNPRADVPLILVRNAAADPIELGPTDVQGEVLASVAEGQYEVRLYPRLLATGRQRAAVAGERKMEPGEMLGMQQVAGTILVPRAPGSVLRVTIPAAAGY